jgi:hypothetical protein
MAIDMDEQDGQTPLDPDEKAGLIPEYLATTGDLNDWEQENILRAVRWLKRAKAPHGEAAAVWLPPAMFGHGTWQPCELQTKVTIRFCLRLFAVERSAHQPTPLCNPNTTLIGWLPWCDW